MLNHSNQADIELGLLTGLFFTDQAELGDCIEAEPDEVPQPQRKLLAHDRHMTVTVEQHHRTPVDVDVRKLVHDGDTYSRKILLTRQTDGQVVQFGIVRLNLALMDREVRNEIEAKQTPLGRILINHDVMREVKLLKLYRILAGPALVEAFGISPGDVCYGRTALIYCNGSPAIELLEIVGNC